MRKYKVIFIGGPKHGMWEPAHDNAREVAVLLEYQAILNPKDLDRPVQTGRYYRQTLHTSTANVDFFAWERIPAHRAQEMFINYLLSPLDLGPAKEPQVKPPSHGPQTDAEGLPRNTDTNP